MFDDYYDYNADFLTEEEAAEEAAIASIETMTDEELYDEYKKIVGEPCCAYDAAIIAAWHNLLREWSDDVPVDDEMEDFYDSLYGEPESDVWAWYSE